MKKSIRDVWFGSFLFVLLAVSVMAQQPNDSVAAQREQMKKLNFLLGEWRGAGWIQMGRERRTFEMVEIVQSKLNGLLLTLEGTGTHQEEIIHQAIALVSFDPAAKVFNWRSHILSGEKLDISIEVGEKTLVWKFRNQRAGGDNRYTIKLDENGNWLERGEFSKDDKNWFQFFEMKLQKMK